MSVNNKSEINKDLIINPSKVSNHPVAKLSSVTQIIIHYTGAKGQKAKDTCNYFKKLASSRNGKIASAHFVVDLDGAVYQSVPLSYVAWHAGNDGVNRSSIGIEMCVGSNGKFTSETVKATQELVAKLMKKYNITDINNIKRHYDITGKMCPEPYVKSTKAWEDFKSGIQTLLSSTPSNNLLKENQSNNSLFESIYNESHNL